jgi:hypothetical protein
MGKVKIATLLCVYGGDRESLFRRALDSVRRQAFTMDVESRIYLGIDGVVPQAIEQIVSDAGSAIFRIVRSPQNRGLAVTLNALIATLADEAFVFRMDSDDFSHPDRYQRQLAHMLDHPEVDILGTDIIEIDEETSTQRVVRYFGGRTDVGRGMAWRVPVAHPTVCFRRRVLERVGGYPLARGNEDVALWFRCVREGFVFDNLHEPLLDFRIDEKFWRRRSVRKAWGELTCYLVGIWTTDRWTWRYCCPLTRFLLRLAPPALSRWAYGLGLRGAWSRVATWPIGDGRRYWAELIHRRRRPVEEVARASTPPAVPPRAPRARQARGRRPS